MYEGKHDTDWLYEKEDGESLCLIKCGYIAEDQRCIDIYGEHTCQPAGYEVRCLENLSADKK